MPLSEQRLLGAAYIIASEVMFTSMGATIKALAVGLPNESLVFFRNAFGLLVLLPLLLRPGRRPGLATPVLHLHLLRALAGLAAMYCFFYALGNLALADAVLLKMTAPIFIPLFAGVWLGEHNHPVALLAVAVGFGGVALLLRPGAEAFNVAVLVGLAGGMLAGLAKTSVRRLRGEPATRVVFYFAVIASVVSALPALLVWQAPTGREWGLLLLLGGFATAGQLLLTRAYACAPAARIGPFSYTSVLFAAGYGWWLWGEAMDLASVIGGGLIVLSGLLALVGRGRALPAAEGGSAGT